MRVIQTLARSSPDISGQGVQNGVEAKIKIKPVKQKSEYLFVNTVDVCRKAQPALDDFVGTSYCW
jgi:hypothetical protein